MDCDEVAEAGASKRDQSQAGDAPSGSTAHQLDSPSLRGVARGRARSRSRSPLDRDGVGKASKAEAAERGRERQREAEEGRDAPDRERSRSRSPKRDRGSREAAGHKRSSRDGGHRHERERERDKEQGRHGPSNANGAVTVVEAGRRVSGSGGAGAGPEEGVARAHGAAASPSTAAATTAAAATGPRVAGAQHQRASSGAGVSAAAGVGAASRLLVSFSDELDEEGGLGGGGGSAGVGGGHRTSGGGGAGGGGMGYGGGNVNLSLAAPSGGSGSGGGPLAANTAARLMREDARMSIPPRTITTTASSSLPQSTLTGPAAAAAAASLGIGMGAAAGSQLFLGGAAAAGAAGAAASNGLYHHSNITGGGVTAAAAVAGMAVEAEAAAGLAGRRVGASPPPSPPRAGGGRSLGRVLFGVATARCARPYMEDRHCIVQSLRPLNAAGQPLPPDGVPRCLAAIYDGHNGVRAADTAAARLHMLLAADAALRSHTGELGPPAAMAAEEAAVGTALRRAFRRLDDDILAEARADGARDGATALLVMRLADTLYSAHAGDSRAVLSRRGAALRLTEDHKPNLPAERARVEAAGGRVDFQRCWRVIVEPRDGRLGSGLAVSRSLGDLDFKEPRRFVECEPDVTRLVPQPGDGLVVLGSDGLWDVMGDQEAVDVAHAALAARAARAAQQSGGAHPSAPAPQKEQDARIAAEALLEAAVRRGTADNVTVIVMLLQWD